MNFICNRMKSDGGAFWNNVYITPWCRVAAFCVGLFLGIIFYKKPKAYLSRVLLHTHILRSMIQKQYSVRCGVPWKIVFYVTAFFLFNSNYNYIIYQYDGILISSCKLPLHNVVHVTKIYTSLYCIVHRWRLLLGGVWLFQSDLLSCIVHTVKIKKMARRGHENSVLCTSPLVGRCGPLV